MEVVTDLGGSTRAEGLQRQIEQAGVRLVFSRLTPVDPAGQHPVADIVHTLEVDAIGDRQLADVKEVFERDLGRVPVPPRALPLVSGAEVGGTGRPLDFDPLDNGL